MALKLGMDLLYQLLWASGTAILVSILVPLLAGIICSAGSGSDSSAQESLRTTRSGVDNGEKRARRSLVDKEGGKFDNRLKVKGSKSKKKKVKFANETANIVYFEVKEHETDAIAIDNEIATQATESFDEKVSFFKVSRDEKARNVNVATDEPSKESNLLEELPVKESEGSQELEIDGGVVDTTTVKKVERPERSELKEKANGGKIGGFDEDTEINNDLEQKRESVGVDEAGSQSGTTGVFLFGVCIGNSDGSNKAGELNKDDKLEADGNADQMAAGFASDSNAGDEPNLEKVEFFKEGERQENREFIVSDEAVYDDQKKDVCISGSEENEERKDRACYVFGLDLAAATGTLDNIKQTKITELEANKVESGKVDDYDMRLTSDNAIGGESQEASILTPGGDLDNENDSKEFGETTDNEGVLSDEEEWEGIERSELEKDFAIATNFVEFGDKAGLLAELGTDVMKQFYGLQKVAMEGPCQERQPMALKIAARAKWNSWQKLGNMSQEDAMEQYITLLSEKKPGWIEGYYGVEAGAKLNAVNPGKPGMGASKEAVI